MNNITNGNIFELPKKKVLTRSEFNKLTSNLLSDIDDKTDNFTKRINDDIRKMLSAIGKINKFLVQFEKIGFLNENSPNVIKNEDIDSFRENFTQLFDDVRKCTDFETFSSAFEVELEYIPESVKIERFHLLPIDLPQKPTKRSVVLEILYDFFRRRVYPIETYFIGKKVRFYLRHSLNYNIKVFLRTLFDETEFQIDEIKKSVSLLTGQIGDVVTFAIEEAQNTITEDPERARRMLYGGVYRARNMTESAISDLKKIIQTHQNEVVRAKFIVGRNIRDEASLAETSAFELMYIARRVSSLWFFTRRDVSKLRKFTKRFYRKSETIAKSMPSLVHRLEQKMTFADLPTSFLRDFDRNLHVPEELERIVSYEPANMPMYYGCEEYINLLSAEYRSFHAGNMCSIALYGQSGVGKKSLLNVAKKNFDEYTEIYLDKRILDKNELEQYLLSKLNLNGENILDALKNSGRKTIILHGIESLYCREIGGFDALKHMMKIISISQINTLWIVVTNDLAYSFLNGAFGFSRIFRSVINLKLFNRQELEKMLLHRLHFSGYRFQYAPENPHNPKAIKDQKKLQKAYFDRLYENSLGSSLSAIFYLANTTSILSDDRLLLSIPPKARFDSLDRSSLAEKMKFAFLIESGGYFENEVPEELDSIMDLAESLRIIVRKGQRDIVDPFNTENGRELYISRALEPLVRQVLSDTGLIR